MSYRVGQVLYVVPATQPTVYPMQIVQEITRKTLEGTEIDYELRAGVTDPKTILLKEIKGEVFETAEKARSVLSERAARSVARMVESAQKKAREWYPGSFEGAAQSGELSAADFVREQSPAMTRAQAVSDVPTVELPDGTVVRVKLPEVLSG